MRDRKKPAIQLSVVKLETPTPEPEPELPDAPSKSARRRKKNKRDEGVESDDSDDGQSFLAGLAKTNLRSPWSMVILMPPAYMPCKNYLVDLCMRCYYVGYE